MNRIWKRAAQLVAVISTMLVVLLFFQNCGQPGSISTKVQDGFDYDDNGILVVKQQAEKTLSASDAPPLKIVFVMDNSNSMTQSNLNLQQSISSMFDSQADNLSQFNAEMYFLTTAQLPSLAGNFVSKIKSPGSLVGSAAQVEDNYRSPFTGLISGDLLGFDVQLTQTPNLILKEYKAQPVVKFEDSPQGIVALPSIKYSKGSSIDSLKAEVATRLNVIAPAKASSLTDASVFPALDSESGLCAMGRILRFPDKYIRAGDITSFVVVSDENEYDVNGGRCLATESREYLYKMTCAKNIPASTVKETVIKYQTKMGAATKKTVFTITPKDKVLPRVITTLKLNRAAKNATCSGTQEREFKVNYTQINSTYSIKYTKQPKIGDREGGDVIYGPVQTNLMTSGQSGNVPADCSNNLNRLKSILSDSTSLLTITSCVQNANSSENKSTSLAYGNFLTVDIETSTNCTDAIKAVINPNGTLNISSCILARKPAENIASSTLAAKGFTSTSSEIDCRTAVDKVCSDSSNSLRFCSFSAHVAAQAAASRGPVDSTQDKAQNCSATCSNFPGLCATDSTTQTVSSFASANNYSCSATTANSMNETYTTVQASGNITIPGAFSCANSCAQVSGACGGTNGSGSVMDYNKSCVAVVSDVAGSPSENKSFNAVSDPDQNINCNTQCTASNGICTAAGMTIGQYITNSLSAQNCTSEAKITNNPATTLRKDITRIKQANLASQACETGYEKEGSPILTGDFEDSNTNVSGSQSLPEYILSRMSSVIGQQAATLSAFITPADGAPAGSSRSYGQVYEQLVNSWGKGSVQDIRSSSYAPALTQLSLVLRSQLLRSVNFPEVLATQRIRSVWKKAKNDSDWGSPIPASDWSATGGTVTLAPTVVLDLEDQVKIEFY
jgi:hypothetical protein